MRHSSPKKPKTPMPEFLPEPTEKATIPMWQADGTIKYIDEEGLKALMDNGMIEVNQSS